MYAEAGSGEPVVLLHGFALDASMWDPQVAALAAEYRVIRYDIRGYGRSSVPDGPYSPVEDFHALRSALATGPVHLVGLSMGGRLALRIAALAPNSVRSLTLADAALDGHVWSDDWLRRWREMVETGRRGDVDGAKQLWLDHPIFAPARRNALAATALGTMLERYSGWHLAHDDPATPPPRPIGAELHSVAAPTLVIVGEKDLPDFHAIARRLATELPNARLEVIAGVGHLPNLEAPHVFDGLLLGHLRHCSPKT